MNIQEKDILNALTKEQFVNQRILSAETGHSLGIINRSLNNLIKDGYLHEDISLTQKAFDELNDCKPKNAIILAAGFGLRMVPINLETPKGLLEVSGEPLIERIIKQLHEVCINDITVVVGFMKEKYEYLIDQFGVNLIVNPEYSTKNNLHSLKLAVEKISDTYIIPCDIWCDENPFNKFELYSWYMVSDLVDDDSTVRVNRKMELITIPESTGGNAMIGISYIKEDNAGLIKNNIKKMSEDKKYNNKFWEEALYNKNKIIIPARVVHSSNAIEINTYEQLRDFDNNSDQLKSDVIDIIARALNVGATDIRDITVMKKGMTNRSFYFNCKGKKYIMRIPYEGSDLLVDRRGEADVYTALKGRNISDEVIYINPDNGYKISEYITGVRNCDENNDEDVTECIHYLRKFHDLNLTVKHEFDLYTKIDFYESLWNGSPSVYKDYKKTKENVLSLRPFVEKNIERICLSHIDANPDNFLISKDEKGNQVINLIDFEYASMQDPHIDIAMFALYTHYNKDKVDSLIDKYFPEGCKKEIRIKIYCYISTCGLLWSNWCEYKRSLGIEFGEYSLREYRFAKDYYRIAMNEIDELGDKNV